MTESETNALSIFPTSMTKKDIEKASTDKTESE